MQVTSFGMFSSSNHLAKEQRWPEWVALIFLCFLYRVVICVLCFFLVVPWPGLWSVITACLGHTHLFLATKEAMCLSLFPLMS